MTPNPSRTPPPASAGAAPLDARRQALRAGLRVALVFLVFGGLWILLSDRALALVVHDPADLTRLQTVKGWTFVLVTALLLFGLVRSEVRRRLEEEERFLRLAENAPDLIYRYRLKPQPGYEYVSPASTRLTGYTPEEHYRDPELRLTLVHPDDRPLLEGAGGEGEEEGAPLVLRWVRKDGKVVWTEQRNVIIPGEDGEPVALEGIARDITDRKLAEGALLARAEFERSLLESSPLAIFVIDRERTVLSWNQAAERMFGWSAEEAVGRSLPVVPPGREEENQALVARIWSGETVRDFELERLTKDGRRILARVSAGPLRDTDGVVTGILATMEDVTQERQAERALAQERALQQRIMEHSPTGIAVLDPEGTLMFANPAAETVLGLTRSEIAGRRYDAPDWEITALDGGPFPHEDLPFARVMRTGEAVSDVRHAIHRRDGRRVLLSVNAAPLLDDEGRIMGVVALLEDISDVIAEQRQREEIEAQLRQAQKLEAVGRLAGGIAHDFNNMLSIILSSADLASQDVPPGTQAARDLAQIRQAAERSAAMTRQLLAFSRKQVVQPRPVDLNDVVRGQETMLRRLIGEEVEIHLDLQEGLWQTFVDPSQVDQILTNLLVNARDAIRGHGSVTITTANVGADAVPAGTGLPDAAGDFVMLSVTDDGAGMPTDVLEHIFEPFFTTKGVGVGTGMGLATVYGIVQQAGGFIQVESEPGHGASFRIHLPRREGPAASVSAEEARRAAEGTESILVVEDEEAILHLTRRFLQRCGYHVLTAGTPDAALRVSREYPEEISLLLSDVILPGMNGRLLEEAIRKERPGIRTVFMSGYSASHIAERGVVPGDVRFLQKPFTLADLAAKVREALDEEV